MKVTCINNNKYSYGSRMMERPSGASRRIVSSFISAFWRGSCWAEMTFTILPMTRFPGISSAGSVKT